MKKLLKKIQIFYPYDKVPFVIKLKTATRIIWIKLLGKRAFSKISIVPHMKRLKKIISDFEFVIRYAVSQVDFEKIWYSQPRDTQTAVELFYSEHDKDIWRQVYLSKYDNHKKKFVLMVADAIKMHSKNPNIKILDYGCGCGIYSNYLNLLGYNNITLADISASTFKFCKDVYKDKFKYITIDKPEPLTENYDIILMIDCLAHAYHPYESFLHVSSHLKTGGLLIIYYETKPGTTHLPRALEQREKTMQYIDEHYTCLKKEQIFIKK